LTNDVQVGGSAIASLAVPRWSQFLPSSWSRSDMAGVAQPHDDEGKPTASYWLAWAPYFTGDRSDPGHHSNVFRRRFHSKEAAMAYVEKTWPLAERS
jgi:hypothetical protein